MFKPEETVGNLAENELTEQSMGTKKAFVEPEITVPVDVLEATTFFQSVTSGATN